MLKHLNKDNLQYEIQDQDDDTNTQEALEFENLEAGVRNLADINSSQKKGALLTQKVDTNPYYDEYTIYPLHGSKINEKDNKLYQMLLVFARAIDYRCKDLDLKFFPELYPTELHGQ
uniref:Uncharacterized protein n=1 Tax=Trichogramma kaykai TaxID=54128 RepID=A0ABD2WA99_9HYME